LNVLGLIEKNFLCKAVRTGHLSNVIVQEYISKNKSQQTEGPVGMSLYMKKIIF